MWQDLLLLLPLPYFLRAQVLLDEGYLDCLGKTPIALRSMVLPVHLLECVDVLHKGSNSELHIYGPWSSG